MKKLLSLIKANFSEGMNLFKVKTKSNNKISKVIIPIFLYFTIMGVMFSYSYIFMKELRTIHMEFVLLTLFILFTSILTLIEGIYKSGNLLFNCRDDSLLLSLPIKKRTILFLRIFKFYIFELMYNSMFLLPSMVLYAYYMQPGISYYIVSIIGLLLLPIVPILLSCLLGTMITSISSRFKGKSIVQTIITFVLLMVLFYFSYNSEKLFMNIAKNASSINDLITKIYYPAGTYIELITNFKILKLLEFMLVHIVLFVLVVYFVGNLYFKINSRTKAIMVSKKSSHYQIKSSSVTWAFMKKEFNRFINSTVFITNAGFGLVLYIIVCIIASIKLDSILKVLSQNNVGVSVDVIQNNMPIILFGFLCFSIFMSSITSSMISLEGKSFSILKSLPLSPYRIVQLKVLTAVSIVIPCMVIGSMFVSIKFHFDLLSILLILVACVVVSFLSETIGIVINLKYPKLDATNDTEVVKQSMSSMIATFLGLGSSGLVAFLLFKCFEWNLSMHLTLLLFVSFFIVVYGILAYWLSKKCDKMFQNIVV